MQEKNDTSTFLFKKNKGMTNKEHYFNETLFTPINYCIQREGGYARHCQLKHRYVW